ncbi:hypothetical protein KUTeg_007466 [Tegillarca granosa]|uniref:Uncharacterized protein n=1 Tax=Tegillarca granosa TaxID=220873 RepID=A0ABQ9FFB6_TEGGR|nr:hypothetical protein KUTeg_007466 [Tegillarca granosa]
MKLNLSCWMKQIITAIRPSVHLMNPKKIMLMKRWFLKMIKVRRNLKMIQLMVIQKLMKKWFLKMIKVRLKLNVIHLMVSLDVDEKMVSENDKSQAEFKSESVNVSIVSENEERSVEIKETLVDEKTTLEINHDSQMESTTDDLKENSLDENSVSEKVTESVEETIAQKQTDKTEEEEETFSLQSEEISPNPKTITDDKGNKSKVKDKKKKDKTKKRSKINSESSHDTVSVTSSSHSDKTESPKSKNKDKSKKKSSKQKDLRDNDSITASECVSNTSDLDHSISEIHKDDDSQCANDKKVVKETVSVDSHEKRKSGNIFSWNLLKSHKTEEEKDKKKKVKMRGVGKDMIQHTVNDAEEANKRRSIFDEEIHIELDDSHDIVSLSSLESDTNSECSSLSETSDNKETQSIVNFDEPDELKLNTQNNGTNNDQDSESMTVLRTGPIPDLLITKSDVEKSQDKSSSNNAITVRENKDEIENVGQDLEPRETVSKSHIESKEKSAIKISIKVEGKYVDPVIYGTSSYHGNGVETQTRGTQTEYVARKQHKVQYNNEDNKINEINEHQDSEKEGHNFSSHLHGFIHKYTLPLVVKAGHSRKNIYGMKKEKNLMFRRHMSDESGYIATNSCNLTRPLSFQYKESKPEMDHDQGEVGSLQLSKYKINQRQPTNEKQGNPDNKSLSTAAKDAEESKEEKKPKSDVMFI